MTIKELAGKRLVYTVEKGVSVQSAVEFTDVLVGGLGQADFPDEPLGRGLGLASMADLGQRRAVRLDVVKAELDRVVAVRPVRVLDLQHDARSGLDQRDGDALPAVLEDLRHADFSSEYRRVHTSALPS